MAIDARLEPAARRRAAAVCALSLSALASVGGQASAQPACCSDRWTTKATLETLDSASPRAEARVTWGPPQGHGATLSGVQHAGPSFPRAGALVRLTFANRASSGSTSTAGTFSVLAGGCNLVSGVQGCQINQADREIATFPFEVITTADGADAIASADAVFFPDLGMAAYVLEGGTAVFELDFATRSTLELINVRLISGEGFVSVGEAPVPLVSVLVDVKPGAEVAPVNPGSPGRLPVALLSSPAWSSLEIDPHSIELGTTGATPVAYAPVDANGDGSTDLMAYFEIRDLGIECGDLTVLLKAATFAGDEVRGVDAIRTTGCGKWQYMAMP
jgi:hypothetical protein